MSERGPLTIYLEPSGEYGSEGRLWCEDNVWDENGGGVAYTRADASESDVVRSLEEQLAAAREANALFYRNHQKVVAELTALREALNKAAHEVERLALQIPAPNAVTPQLMQLSIAMKDAAFAKETHK